MKAFGANYILLLIQDAVVHSENTLKNHVKLSKDYRVSWKERSAFVGCTIPYLSL